MKLAIALMTLAPALFAGEKKPPAQLVADGVLTDFTESRYNGGSNVIFWQLNGSCVSRNYTVRMINGREIVLQHNTCAPNRDRAPLLEIGQPVTTVEGKRPDQMGLYLPDGKILWMRIFKITRKPESGK